jgi:hypothetical protein
MRAICSTETPARLSRNGRAVEMNPTYIPRGRINKVKTQGVGHRRALPRRTQHTSCGSAPYRNRRPHAYAISKLSSQETATTARKGELELLHLNRVHAPDFLLSIHKSSDAARPEMHSEARPHESLRPLEWEVHIPTASQGFMVGGKWLLSREMAIEPNAATLFLTRVVLWKLARGLERSKATTPPLHTSRYRPQAYCDEGNARCPCPRV